MRIPDADLGTYGKATRFFLKIRTFGFLKTKHDSICQRKL